MDPTIQQVSRGKVFMETETFFQSEVKPETDPLAFDSVPNPELAVKLEMFSSEPENEFDVDPLAIDIKDEIDESGQLPSSSLRVSPTSDIPNEDNHETDASRNADPLFDPDRDLIFSCQSCSYKSYFESSLATHKLCHTSEKIVHHCQECDFSSTTKLGIAVHSRIHLRGKLLVCSFCPYKSKSNGAMSKHNLLLHSNETGLMCIHCSYRTNSKNRLVTHLKKHTVESPFRSKKAGRKRRRAGKYKCSQCNYTSCLKFYFDNHVRSHLNEGPHACVELEVEASDEGSRNDVDPLGIDIKTVKDESSSSQMLLCSDIPRDCDSPTQHFQTANISLISPGEEFHVVPKTEAEDLRDSENISIEDSLTTPTTIQSIEEYLNKQNSLPIIAERNVSKFLVKSEVDAELPVVDDKHRTEPSHNTDPHFDPTKDVMFSCHMCPYVTHFECSLASHKLSHILEKYQVPMSLALCEPSCSSSNTLPSSKDTEASHDTGPLNHSLVPPRDLPYSCDLCSYHSTSERNLDFHKTRYHSSAPKYQCSQCEYIARSSSHLNNHLQKHTEERPYDCNVCGSKFKFSSNLAQHKITHSTEKRFRCKHCDYSCHVQRDLKRHMRRHSRGTHVCEICSLNCVSRRSLTHHMLCHFASSTVTSTQPVEDLMEHDSNIQAKAIIDVPIQSEVDTDLPRKNNDHLSDSSQNTDTDGESKCNLSSHKLSHVLKKYQIRQCSVSLTRCESSCSSSNTLPSSSKDTEASQDTDPLNHSHVPPRDLPYSCDLCSYHGNSRRSLAIHKHWHSKKKNMYHCSQCAYGTNVKGHLVVHLKKHSDCSYAGDVVLPQSACKGTSSRVKKYKCSYCEYKSHTKQGCDIHQRVHSGERPYACEVCGYNSRSHCGLINHKQTHLLPTRLKCSQCDYGTNLKSSLRDHLSTHSDERPYACHLCSYRSPTKKTLGSHIKHHSSKKKHRCSKCGYGSHTKREFDNHMRRHTGEQPFGCDLCSFKSAARSSLHTHKLIHSSGKRFKCVQCEYSTNYKGDLEIHIKKHYDNKRSVSEKKRSKTWKYYKCSQCKYRTVTRKRIIFHLSSHSFVSSFECDLCTYKCTTSRAFAGHMKRHTRVNQHKCVKCDFRSGSLDDLDKHMKSHPGVLAFNCDVCSYNCATGQKLRTHKRLHAS